MFSGIIWVLLAPMNALFLVMAAGAGISALHRRAGRAVMGLGVALFLFFGIVPVGDFLLSRLEAQHSRPAEMPEKIAGILVLGGAFDVPVSFYRDSAMTNGAGERIMDGVKLLRDFPEGVLLFSGGNGSLQRDQAAEAGVFLLFAQEFDLPMERVLYEDRSRNTYENIANSKGIAEAQPEGVWLVVTSAFHMGRTMAVIKALGWPGDVVPYPTDYRTRGMENLWPERLDVLGNYESLHTALREYMALFYYRMSGKIALTE